MIYASSLLWSFRNDLEVQDTSCLRYIVSFAAAGGHALASQLLFPRGAVSIADS